MKPPVLRAAGAADVEEAYEWYEGRRKGHPEVAPVVHLDTRRFLLRRFRTALTAACWPDLQGGLPKPVIEGAGLQEEIELQVRGNTVVIGFRKRPRVGWAEAAKQMRQVGDDQLLDKPIPTKFEQRDWRWR